MLASVADTCILLASRHVELNETCLWVDFVGAEALIRKLESRDGVSLARTGLEASLVGRPSEKPVGVVVLISRNILGSGEQTLTSAHSIEAIIVVREAADLGEPKQGSDRHSEREEERNVEAEKLSCRRATVS